jgi:RNA polymerase sigma factor for flagellar operon FliA
MSIATPESLRKRDEIIRENMPLVRQVAQRFHVGPTSPVDMSDLMQYGVIGLIDACEKFDESKGASFQSYARFRIRGSILDGLRHLDFLPRSVRRKRRELFAAQQRVEQAQQGAASSEEIAEEMDLEPSELQALLESVRGASLASVEDMTERGGEAELADAMGAGLAEGPDGRLERSEVKALLMDALEALPEKERLALSLYYYEELTMREVGEVLGVTESRVSQLHAKALLRLKSRLTADAFTL